MSSTFLDQIKSPVPFFAVSRALSGLFRHLLSESEAHLVVWRRRLTRAMGKEGRILSDYIPTLENLFEPLWLEGLPQILPLTPAESGNRFQSLVKKVLR